MTYAFFVFAIANFASFMLSGFWTGERAPGSEVRVFSGHWTAFYSMALAMLYSATRIDAVDATRRCRLSDQSWRPDVLERAIGSPDAIALVHRDGSGLDGFICAHDVGFRTYLSELVVAPAAQRHGIGARLLAAVERRLVERGSQ